MTHVAKDLTLWSAKKQYINTTNGWLCDWHNVYS